jgi:hypothetical protein
MTAIELAVIIYKISEIRDVLEISKELGILERYRLDIIENFMLRMYMNYREMIIVLIVIILFINIILSTLLYVMYTVIESYIIPLL